jgi:hypothetical protein
MTPSSTILGDRDVKALRSVKEDMLRNENVDVFRVSVAVLAVGRGSPDT